MNDFSDYLSVEDMVRIAERVIDGEVVVEDWGLLASAVARPQASAFGADAYPTLETKAAALLLSITCNQVLQDGNKRLGWASAVVFCELNGYDLLAPRDSDAIDIVLAIADGSLRDVSEVAKTLAGWMRVIEG